MRKRKQIAIALFVVAIFLFGIQAGIWAKSTSQARSETDKQNIEQRHPPNELAGVAGIFLLIAAGVVASMPKHNHN